MGATKSSDFTFEPKVFADHVDAFFRQKLVFGQFAIIDKSLEAEPGETVNFPFYGKIGPAEEPGEDDVLTVDRLTDDAYTCTVKEVGKAVGFKQKAFYTSAAKTERNLTEAQRQIGRVHAEKVDSDLVTTLASASAVGFLASAAADLANIRNINQGRITAFGDLHDEAVAIFMHSRQFLDLLNDTTAGFLKADATDPMFGQPGFSGRLLGMALMVNDAMPQVADIDSKNAFEAFIIKAEPYGVCMKQEAIIESDKDILAREVVIVGTQWYGTVNLHAKVASDDLRIAKLTTTVS